MKKIIFLICMISLMFVTSCDSTHTIGNGSSSFFSSVLFAPLADCGGSGCL